jgi:hypothetical protein
LLPRWPFPQSFLPHLLQFPSSFLPRWPFLQSYLGDQCITLNSNWNLIESYFLLIWMVFCISPRRIGMIGSPLEWQLPMLMPLGGAFKERRLWSTVVLWDTWH